MYTVLAVLVAIIIAVCLSGSRRIRDSHEKRMLVGICLFQLSFEILWRLVYFFVKGDTLSCWWPIYPCNLAGILIPIIALTNWTAGKKMLYLFGFVGGVLTFALPEDIFTSDVLVFPILKSIFQHTGILLIPLFEYASDTFRPGMKYMKWVIAGLMVHLVNSKGIARLFGFWGDYMLFRSGMPFVIPGIPQFITLSVFALLVLVLLSMLSDFVNKQLQRAEQKKTANQEILS